MGKVQTGGSVAVVEHIDGSSFVHFLIHFILELLTFKDIPGRLFKKSGTFCVCLQSVFVCSRSLLCVDLIQTHTNRRLCCPYEL